MNPSLDMVNRARLPTSALSLLAGLRRVEGISVVGAGEVSWITWEGGDDQVLRALIPIEGVELFESRDGTWFRPGHRLPSFDAPPNWPTIGLDRAVTPSRFASLKAASDGLEPARLRLVPDERPRTTTATACTLAQLAGWADRATSAEIGGIRVATSEGLALLLGPRLPVWSGARRYWGTKLLVPLGFEPSPRLPEGMIRDVLGVGTGDLVRMDATESGLTVETIPIHAFRTMTRAGVRLATGGVRHEP